MGRPEKWAGEKDHMSKFKIAAAVAAIGIVGASNAKAAVFITEFQYNAYEFVEFTNTGNAPVDFTGWSFDDSSQTAGSFDLSGFGIVAAGESVILAELSDVDFRAAWGLSNSVKVVGLNDNNLGNGDEINIYDASSALVDRLTFGSEPRTNIKSAVPTIASALGANNIAQWAFTDTLAGGGIYDLSGVLPPSGFITATNGTATGNPGFFIDAEAAVPEPASMGLIGVAGLLALRRRRAM